MTILLIAVVVAVAVAFVVVVRFRPSAFRTSRTATIAAPPAAVFAAVNDLRQWEAWNPWQELDPSVRNAYSGPATGVGSSCAWTSRKVGTGRSTIVESRPDEAVRFRLDMEKPFRAASEAEFTFRPEGGGTAVTWTMWGRNDHFVCKAFGLVFSHDKMCGGAFEKGLRNLGAHVAGRK